MQTLPNEYRWNRAAARKHRLPGLGIDEVGNLRGQRLM